MATCPECDFDEIDTDDFEEGDTLNCPECGKNLVMTGPDDVDVVDEDDDLDDDDEEEEEEEEADEEDLDEEEDVEDEDLDE